MKIRSGFVSNSSSSSFVVCNTLEYTAETMLDIVIRDWSEWDRSETKSFRDESKRRFKEWRNRLKKALKNPEVQSGKIGITFPSTNEETYIVWRRDRAFVQTCNNHDWSVVDGRGQDCDGVPLGQLLDEIIQESFFYNLDNEAIHSAVKYGDSDLMDRHCLKCKQTSYGYCLDRKGSEICRYCGKTIKPAKPVVKTFPSPVSDLEVN